jgi:hypothetical protein
MSNINEAKKRRSAKDGPEIKEGSAKARKIAALIFEVLAGEIHPAEAAAALEIGMQRYYQLEKKALLAVVKACEPATRKGRRKSEAKVIAELKISISRLERDLKRAQALARMTQKAEGIATIIAQAKKSKSKTGRKRRKPVARALKLAKSLRENCDANIEQASINQAPAVAVTPNG